MIRATSLIAAREIHANVSRIENVLADWRPANKSRKVTSEGFLKPRLVVPAAIGGAGSLAEVIISRQFHAFFVIVTFAIPVIRVTVYGRSRGTA